MLQKNMLLSSLVKDVERLDPFENLHLFICIFDTKACSSASTGDFVGIIKVLRELKIQSDKTGVDPVNRNVGWRFFCLGKRIQAYREDGYLNDIALPFVKRESTRLAKLKDGIESVYTSLEQVELPEGQGYCQFSGGGDMCFVSSKSEATVITTAEEDMVDSSPRNDFEEINIGVIEGKKMEGKSQQALISQLQANMIVACVNTFVNNLITGIIDKNLIELQMLSSYGIVCTSAGDFGFMKLEIDFLGKKMTFVDKIRLAQKPHVLTAVYIDLALDYIVGKLKTEQLTTPDSDDN